MRHLRLAGLVAFSCVATLFAFSAPDAKADDYPRKPIRLLVGYPPGGPVDYFGRIVADFLVKDLGQPIVVENKPGASGTIALEELARAKPDGYTLEIVPSPAITISPYLQSVRFKPTEDFTPISNLVIGPLALVVRKDFPANNIDELIAAARANPARYTFGSAGKGGSNHLAGELFQKQGQLRLRHVAYTGVGPALRDVMGLHIDMMFLSIGEAYDQLQAGSIKGIAVGSKERNRRLPDLPTLNEAALPGYEAVVWYSLMAPAKLPANIMNRLNRAIMNIAADPKFTTPIIERGYDVIPSTPESLGERVRAESQKWANIISELGKK